MSSTVEDRFWSKVDQSGGPDACWPWTASVFTRGGYGKFQAGTSRATAHVVYAHRFALQLAEGTELAPGEMACHRCDNPICCNPRHLFRGTAADNMRDMAAKDRHGNPPGRRRAKLSPTQVREIRRRYSAGGESHDSLAAEFGVSVTNIYSIVNHRSWRAVA